MFTEASLVFAFDALARQAVDPVLDAIENEHRDNPAYLFSTVATRPASRRECRLTIKSCYLTKVRLTASFIITEASPNDTVRVETSDAGVEDGKRRLIVTLKWPT